MSEIIAILNTLSPLYKTAHTKSLHKLITRQSQVGRTTPNLGLYKRMDMKGRSLRWLVENLKANHGYYLLGELYIDSDKIVNVTQIENYHPRDLGWESKIIIKPWVAFLLSRCPHTN
jgi:hypothetical protein